MSGGGGRAAETEAITAAPRPPADYFPLDPTEPHWRWHADRVCGVLERARDPQVRAWLAPMLDTFRLRYVALNERLDAGLPAPQSVAARQAGDTPTVSDHDWRAFFDLQEKIERHVRLEGNPVDGAVNHVLRRFGQVPVFGVVDSLVWKELLAPEQIKQGMRPISRSDERKVGRWRWDCAEVRWRSGRPMPPGAVEYPGQARSQYPRRRADPAVAAETTRTFNWVFAFILLVFLLLCALFGASR